MYLDLTKFGIVVFVLLVTLAGYLLAAPTEGPFLSLHVLRLIGGVYFLASGSLALNQVQEWRLDQKMQRTARRPIASGQLTPWAGLILASSYLIVGSYLLFQMSVGSFLLGILNVSLYNGFYTYWWKPRWPMAALPGAIPGALPVLMGYFAWPEALADSAHKSEPWYLFLLLFLWQMPHFWLLAIKYKGDYAAAGIPTLPVAKGEDVTKRQIVWYTIVYIIAAMFMPLFTTLSFSWSSGLILVLSGFLGLFLMWRYVRDTSQQAKSWFLFFMWVNLSILVFLSLPVFAKWYGVLAYRI